MSAQGPLFRIVAASAAMLYASALAAQTSIPEEFRVYTGHPRLFLRPQRLRLLKRERERESLRWRQFESLMKTGAPMPEPGFSLALYAAIASDTAAAKRAIDWALGGTATDLRQLALVYDWCQDALTPEQGRTLLAKLKNGIASQNSKSLEAHRNRVLAIIAAADDSSHPEEGILRDTVEGWFRAAYTPQLTSGTTVVSPPESYALIELMHAVRDNVNIDLRDFAPSYFKIFPEYLVASNYPAPYPGPANEYRIPVFTGNGQPDLVQASLARAAGLSMVGFDTNAEENQFLQGWLIQDRFMLRDAFGAPYEFLWANPYQPGLSFFHLPLTFHDPESGGLFIRSSWDEDAEWFGMFRGEAQFFRDGKITVLNMQGASASKPVELGETSVFAGHDPIKFTADNQSVFVVGLKPHGRQLVEVDDEELRQEESDAAGTTELHFPPHRNAGVRIKDENDER